VSGIIFSASFYGDAIIFCKRHSFTTANVHRLSIGTSEIGVEGDVGWGEGYISENIMREDKQLEF
jgi:hypothetical protein